MVYDYITTKPELNEETLAHYGIKGMKWKKRLKGSFYSAKSKAEELGTKAIRNILYGYGAKDPSRISYNRGTDATPRNDNGKANSKSGNTGSKVKEGIAAGRKRVKKKSVINKFNARQTQKAFPTVHGYEKSYAQDFRTNNKNGKNRMYINPKAGSTRGQGYSSSIGSADNNKATNKSLAKKTAASRAKKNRKAK